MLRRGARAGAVAQGQTRIFKMRVLAVDKTRYTLTVLGENNEYFEGVPAPVGYLGSKGQGSFWMPEENSFVYVCSPSDGHTPFVLAGVSLPREQEDDTSDQDDFRQARPVINEGDHVVASSEDGNFIILRKGGVVEIGASQTAQRLYVPINSVIMDFCQNYVLQSTGGSLEWITRRDDQSWGGGAKTPTEFRLRVREFTGEDALIDLGFGRIQEEDDELLVGGNMGEIVARLLINDRFRIWIDKAGNLMRYTHGEQTSEHNGKVVERYASNYFQQILGRFQARIGAREVTVAGDDSLDVGNRRVHVRGNLTETVDGTYSRSVKGYNDTIDGARETTVNGFERKSVLGFEETLINDNQQVTVGKGSSEIVGGKKSVRVVNGVPGEDVGYELSVVQGELRIFNLTGKVRIVAGGPTADAVLSAFTIKPSGAILLESTPAAGLGSIEVNTSGISIQTPVGQITLDQAGTVYLGPPGGGAVVTTLTHPVDYVTGAPIFGVASVVAGGIPSPVGGIPSFVPDVTP